MKKTLEEYESGGGWSSHFFAEKAVTLIKELQKENISVTIGRTVIHISHNGKSLKTYVHHNGRSREYATITDKKGNELITVHYTEFEKLEEFIKGFLCQ